MDYFYTCLIEGSGNAQLLMDISNHVSLDVYGASST